MLLGSRLTLAVPDRPLRLVLATVLGLSGLKLLDIPGSTAVIVILLGALFLALLVWIGRRTWEIRRSRTERLATG